MATPSADEAAVTPSGGGRLSTRDRKITVDVPGGAAAEPLRIRYEPASEGRRGAVRIARSFHLSAVNGAGQAATRFLAPLTIRVKYSSDELALAGVDETTAALYYLNEGGTWERLPSEVDEESQQVSGTVDHFSVFAVGGETFETATGSGNAFSDNFANLLAWTTASGGGTVSSSSLTSNGANGVYDIFVVTNSGSYSDFTYQAQVRDASLNGSHRVGLIGRYQSTSNYYTAALSGGNTLSLYKVVGGTTTLVGSATQAYSANTPYWLKLDMAGSSIKVSFATDSGGSPGSFTQKISVTDASLTRGQVGLINANAGGSTRRGIFAGPGVTSSLPQDWGGIVQQTGRPGLIWDKVTAAHGGSGSLQLFGGNSSFVGYAAQTTNNTVTAGAAYNVSGWIKTTSVTAGGSNGAKILLVEQPSGTQTTLATQTGTQGWTQYTSTVTLRSDTTRVDTRAVLQGSGTANFDDIAISEAATLTMTLSTTAAAFGTTLGPSGITSDQANVGAGYVDGNNGAYYVGKRDSASHAVTVTVSSNRAWSGSASASENSGTAGMTIAGGSMRWKLGDMADLADAKGGTAFGTAADSTVFNAASSCSSGATKQAGTCTYNYDYSLRILWSDEPGTFSSAVTYSAAQ